MNDDFVLPNDDSVVPSSIIGDSGVTADPVGQVNDLAGSSDPVAQKPKKDPLDLLEELLADANKNNSGGDGGAGKLDPVAQAKKEAEEKAEMLAKEKALLEEELAKKQEELAIKDQEEIEKRKKDLEDLKLNSPQGLAKQQQADEKQHQIDEKQQANDGFEIEQLGHTKIVE